MAVNQEEDAAAKFVSIEGSRREGWARLEFCTAPRSSHSTTAHGQGHALLPQLHLLPAASSRPGGGANPSLLALLLPLLNGKKKASGEGRSTART